MTMWPSPRIPSLIFHTPTNRHIRYQLPSMFDGLVLKVVYVKSWFMLKLGGMLIPAIVLILMGLKGPSIFSLPTLALPYPSAKFDARTLVQLSWQTLIPFHGYNPYSKAGHLKSISVGLCFSNGVHLHNDLPVAFACKCFKGHPSMCLTSPA